MLLMRRCLKTSTLGIKTPQKDNSARRKEVSQEKKIKKNLLFKYVSHIYDYIASKRKAKQRWDGPKHYDIIS